MNRIILFFLCFFIGISCHNKNDPDYLSVMINVEQDDLLLLSEITDHLQVVELELTEESLIGNLDIQERILVFDEFIILLDGHKNQILLFDDMGKFIVSIGNKGLGPGEFTQISDITADIHKKRIYIATDSKILTYDFDGHFLREMPFTGFSKYLNYINDELMLITSVVGQEHNEKRYFNETILYGINDDGNIVDSVGIYKEYFDKQIGIASTNKNYITVSGNDIYLYYPVFLSNRIPGDTLFQLNTNRLQPYLQLGFSDGKNIPGNEYGNKYVHKLYRSARYIFSHYHGSNSPEGFVNFYFCYDTKTNKGYHLKGGYTDDLYTGQKVRIRPLDMDTERFYYFYTNLDDERLGDESSPTLYIGTLKK